MKLFRLLPLLLYLLFALSPATAQETTDTGWPIEERCLGEPTPPPDGWIFPGAILMTGHYGIHAISADIPTPYVVAFIPDRPHYRAETLTGVLSPDQYWYATTEADIYQGGLSSETSVYKIVIYSTVAADEKYQMDWENIYDDYSRSIRWRDNEHIVYESSQTFKIGNNYSSDNAFLINPFTQEIDHWDGQLDPLPINGFFPSNDWTRAVYNQQWYDYSQDVKNEWGLFDPITGNQLASLPLSMKSVDVVWSAASSRFISIMGDWDQSQQLSIFDKEGMLQETIFTVTEDFRIESDYQIDQGFKWSNNGRYLAFIVATNSTPYVYELYLADFETKHILKTCFSTYYGLAFSPDSNLLALNATRDLEGPILVLDLSTWELHTVAYHNGDIIGWRGD